MSLLGVFASPPAPGGKDVRQVSNVNQQTTCVHWRVTNNSLEKECGPDECGQGVCKPRWVCCAESEWLTPKRVSQASHLLEETS